MSKNIKYNDYAVLLRAVFVSRLEGVEIGFPKGGEDMSVYDLSVLLCMALVAISAGFDVIERISRKIKNRRRPRDKD